MYSSLGILGDFDTIIVYQPAKEMRFHERNNFLHQQ